jgi:hypothetical protein
MLVIDNKKKLNHSRQSTLNNRYPTPHNKKLATTPDSDTRQSKVSSLTIVTRQPTTNNNDHQQIQPTIKTNTRQVNNRQVITVRNTADQVGKKNLIILFGQNQYKRQMPQPPDDDNERATTTLHYCRRL